MATFFITPSAIDFNHYYYCYYYYYYYSIRIVPHRGVSGGQATVSF